MTPEEFSAADPLWARLIQHSRIDESGCWLWQGAVQSSGYGHVYDPTAPHRMTLAHRTAYAVAVGPIPDGLEIDHLCRVRLCWNPAHLEAVTGRENRRRSLSPAGINARKQECIHGHPFDQRNTGYTKGGSRYCRRCAADHMARTRARQRGVSDHGR